MNDLTSDDLRRQSVVCNEIKKRITASLVSNHDKGTKDDDETNGDETAFDWRPGADFFDDYNDPRREIFDPHLDYYRNDDDLAFASKVTSMKYRRLQLVSQMHQCCFTCFKYGPECRFHYPQLKENCHPNEVIVEITRDKKNRKQIKAKPPRNNAHLNVCFTSPLVHLAHGGNCDAQFMQNAAGAVEYCASYSSKQDTPDFKLLDNIIAKKLANLKIHKTSACEKDEFKIVANAFFASQQVGAVQVCYNLLNLDHVISSRRVENVNPLPRSMVFSRIVTNKQLLDSMNPSESASASTTPASTLGRRDAFAILTKQQWDSFQKCDVTLFALLTSYTIHEATKTERRVLQPPPFLQLDQSGMRIRCCR